ncbi:MAG: hypothetical protein HY721_18630, partial [Planctomycetes bacterium]|nr:hypothetical protein [Planctomycetota bacterium]
SSNAPAACSNEGYAPVCSGNGVTYANASLARLAGEAYASGTCVLQCTDIYDPVCAFNGITYRNACLANADQERYTAGSCQPPATGIAIQVPAGGSVTGSVKERTMALTAPSLPAPEVVSVLSKPPSHKPPSATGAAIVPAVVAATMAPPSELMLSDHPWAPGSVSPSPVVVSLPVAVYWTTAPASPVTPAGASKLKAKLGSWLEAPLEARSAPSSTRLVPTNRLIFFLLPDLEGPRTLPGGPAAEKPYDRTLR